MLIGVRDDCTEGASLLEKMIALRDMAYDFVELVVSPEMLEALTGSEKEDKFFPKKALRELNNAVSETGLPILSISYSNMFEYAAKDDAARAACRRELRQAIELASTLGAKTILSATCETQTNLQTAAELFGRELRAELDFALSRNVRVCFEPVARTTNAAVVMLTRIIDHPATYTYFDMGNCLFFGEDPIAQLFDCVDCVGALHIKPGGREMPLGEMPLTGILGVLDDAGFDGVGVMEMKGGEGNRVLAHAIDLLDTLGYRD